MKRWHRRVYAAVSREIKGTPEVKVQEGILHRLLQGPATRGELPKTQSLATAVIEINRQMLGSGRRIVSHAEQRKSRLGLTVREMVYELVKEVA